MRVILPEKQKQHKEQNRPLTRYEQAIMHQENLARIRAEIPKRKRHRQRMKAAKKAVKEFLVITRIEISLGLAFLYAIEADTYEPPKPQPRMIKAMGGDYYYPEDQYYEYLKERAAYMEKRGCAKEKNNER